MGLRGTNPSGRAALRRSGKLLERVAEPARLFDLHAALLTFLEVRGDAGLHPRVIEMTEGIAMEQMVVRV